MPTLISGFRSHGNVEALKREINSHKHRTHYYATGRMDCHISLSILGDYPSLVRMDYYLLFSTQRDDHPTGRMACYLSQITLGSYHTLGWMDYQRYLSILGNCHSLLKIDYHLLSSTQGDYHPSDRMVSYLSHSTLGNNHTPSQMDCHPSLITIGGHTSYSVLQIVWMSCWFPFFKMETN